MTLWADDDDDDDDDDDNGAVSLLVRCGYSVEYGAVSSFTTVRLASVVADLTGSLQGQLLDCGLAKLAPLPTEETGTNDTILGSTTNSRIFVPTLQ